MFEGKPLVVNAKGSWVRILASPQSYMVEDEPLHGRKITKISKTAK